MIVSAIPPSGADAAQRSRLAALLRDSPVGLASLSGPEHMVTVTNARFRQLAGPRPLAGLRLREALPELQDQPFFALLDQAYQTGAIGHGHEEVQLTTQAPGDPRGPVYFTFLAQAVRDPAGAVTGLLLFAYDVSAHVQARLPADGHGLGPALTAHQLALANEALAVTNEELTVSHEQLLFSNAELATANEQLRVALADNQAQALDFSHLSARHDVLDTAHQHLARANVDLDAFVYTASHDLQGPIDNLDGLLHALREELPETERAAPVARILELMHESVERFQHTLRELSAIARVKPVPGQPLPLVPLADVVRDVLLDLALPLVEADVQLTVQVDACPAIAFAEKNLRSVVYNLLSNAVKYRHPDRVPEVQLRCRRDAHHTVLEVQDNGLGVDLPPGPPAFALFQRFHTHVDGSGVGLYMVQKLVENEGGRLEVTSAPGCGSTFRVYFPQPAPAAPVA
ncbi:MAG TPA: ATP-binding protein [Hymenobacter sp.]|uniref:sensor histidine kinase n=1 Tax=Hymenobacter sp. TaxID=1898978 RepID=UPI002ED8951C